jgi:hypothetical protein
MPKVRILDHDKDIGFATGDGAVPSGQHAALLAGLQSLARKVNETPGWSADERATFQAMRRIVFFEGQVKVNNWTISRPGCDERSATFYWEVEEFMRNTDDDVRANTFFHDCCHVMQFKDRGFAHQEDDRVAREVDATRRQIAVARKLGCSPAEIEHLERFMNDNTVILARLREGVKRMIHHPRPLQA